MRDPGHADSYRQLTVQYIDHHNPDLILLDADDVEIQRIDLTRLKTTHNIHKMMRMPGMKGTCRDTNPDCANWARDGQCDQNPAFMHQSCRKLCALCDEDASPDDGAIPCTNSAPEHDCEYWCVSRVACRL